MNRARLFLLSFLLPLAAALLAMFGGGLRAEPGPEDVAKSWDEARVYLPGSESFLRSPKDVKPGKPAPAVLFMHGCTGIDAAEAAWGSFLQSHGYVVVIPDSFARSRPRSCDPRTNQGGLFPTAIPFRRDEIRYALTQLQEAPWVDARNIFLMGHSEGGVLVSLTDVPGVRGVIVSAWVCTSPRFPNLGLKMAADMPVMVIDHESDAWYAASPGRHCSEYFAGRPKARHVMLPGAAHNTFEPGAQQPLLDFLSAHRAGQ